MRVAPLRLASMALALVAVAVVAADTASVNAQAADPQRARSDSADKTAHAACITECTARDARCGSDVRRARQECSRNAANAGRDPMSMRRDYAYFCGHFSNPGAQCGAGDYASGCVTRYELRYGVCIDDMNYNIAGMRYDCYKAERDATRMCRDELQDCKRACGAG